MSGPDDGSGDGRQDVEEAALAIAHRFEGAWPAEIDGYLPPDGDVRRLAVVHLSNIDLELRWGVHGIARAEDYLERFASEWAADRPAALELVVNEYELRGEVPAPEAFCERFPALRDDLLAL